MGVSKLEAQPMAAALADDLALRSPGGLLWGEGARPASEGEIILAITARLVSSTDLRASLFEVSALVASALGIDRASIALLDEDGEHATVVASSDAPELADVPIDLAWYPEIRRAVSEPPTSGGVVIDDTTKDAALADVRRSGRPLPFVSVCAVPMVGVSRTVGVLFLRSRAARLFQDHAVSLFRAIANTIALALRNTLFLPSVGFVPHLQLAQTKDFLEQLIDSSFDAIVSADMQGRIILFNGAAERIFGMPAREVLGTGVERLYPEGTAKRVMSLMRGGAYGGPGRLERFRTEFVASTGEIIPISLSAALITHRGSPIATVGIFTDLRERLRMEHSLAHAQEQLRIQEKQTIVAELAGAAAHELNQPLTSVMGYAELLRRRLEPDSPQRHAADVILGEAERMAEIVRKIGKITRYETKSYVGDSRILDLDRASREESIGPPPPSSKPSSRRSLP